ncbi:pectate lyase [Hymenobacter cellulosilyticus]|uniref:Pectate lyase n=1 Tax=Hymenobacter cellulosilyticus TaxID=2932248 RepID=A0A8T9QFV9_9BACT|nr:pectate lyase [Hymenobacter cellulosilyticus]UOQ75038.1 pectate lyase [Hymenobacter cellulosilyticus]
MTYNDNAMVRVLNLLKAVAEKQGEYAALDPTLASAAKLAVDKGVSCILKTQYVQNGKLTAWCAQHDRKTLLPVKARAFELASLSGAESVGIVQFLMSLDNPSPEVKKSIQAAVAWFQAVKMEGYVLKDVVDAAQPTGRDRVIVPEAGAVLWARFYDLETNKPIYVGRDGQKRSQLSEIENERRAGYVYASTWPQKLLTKDYPKWQQKWEKKEGSKI